MAGVSPSPPRRPRRTVNGLVLLDKPTGLTSNGALQRVRWLFAAQKAGHTGSLDPLASGLLPVCLGEATKFSGYLLEADKTYRVQLRFGARTDTGDADGAVVEECDRRSVGRDQLEEALARMVGPQMQVPPMYSALKQDGQRLYTLARAGRTVARQPRPIVIHRFALEEYDPGSPQFSVRCSKGTYVRVLVEDLARRLGTLAHVIMLRRIGVGGLGSQPMLTLEQLEAVGAGGFAALDALLLPVDTLVKEWPAVVLGAAEAGALAQGRSIASGPGAGPGLVRLYGPGDGFLGLGEVVPGPRIVVRRLLDQGTA